MPVQKSQKGRQTGAIQMEEVSRRRTGPHPRSSISRQQFGGIAHREDQAVVREEEKGIRRKRR